MKIVLTTKGETWASEMDARFGRSEYFLIYDEDTDKVSSFNNNAIDNEAHGAGPKTVQKLMEFEADVLITGNGPGGNASTVLKSTNIVTYVGAGNMTVKDAYEAYKNGKLEKF